MVWDNGITARAPWCGTTASRQGHHGVGQRHHGKGTMVWDNGITYEGGWHDGKFHGVGSKLYSRGGGYEGEWFGYERWDGPFQSDQPNGAGFEFKMGKPQQQAPQYDGRLSTLDDGSPSTAGMKWDNGITYKGVWKDGVYHGHGRKLYSRGGGYEGPWVDGKREGQGISYYDPGVSLGKHGILRWEGPFVGDRAH
eukprot:gene7890-41540_t